MTRWAKYDSGNEGVATVDNYGHVNMHSFGEAPVTVWYQSHVTFSRLRIPYPYKIWRRRFQEGAAAQLHRRRHPAPPGGAAHSAFSTGQRRGIHPPRLSGCRRNSAHPRRGGAVPEGSSPDKRAAVDRAIHAAAGVRGLLGLQVVGPAAGHRATTSPTKEMWSYYNWIHDSVAANKPWDQFVYEIVTATGNARREWRRQLLG